MLKDFLRNWSPKGDASELPRQAGALPYSLVEGQVVFLLVTSRHSGRWIFPKGQLVKSLTPWESAAQEAFEEAGVSGEIAETPIGSYRTALSDAEHSLAQVDLFPLRVTTQHDDWPEKAERHRHWALLADTRRLLARRRPAALAEQLSLQVLRAPR